MKMIYVLVGILMVAGFLLYLNSCKNKTKEQTTSQTQDTIEPEKVDPKNNPYNDLRNMALGVTAEQIGVQLPSDKTKIYGIVMDWDLGDGTATLVSFISGDASLYLSSGGGFIGGVGHENIKQAVSAFIIKAETYLNKTLKTEETPLPDKNGLKFYFLTNNGKFVGKEEMKNIENNSSEWLTLFEEANKVITEIRISSEKNTTR